MKARTLDELSDFLSDELGRRRREIINLDGLITDSREHEKTLLLRAGFMLVYAHWEGFIKAAGNAYLRHIRSQRLPYDRLKPNILAVAVKSDLETLGDTNRATLITQIVTRFTDSMAETALFEWAGELDARANLNSEVLREILCLLGLDYKPYETKKVFIDNELLSNRNDIAHGQHIEPDPKSYEQARDLVLSMLEQFRTDVENAAALRKYLKV